MDKRLYSHVIAGVLALGITTSAAADELALSGGVEGWGTTWDGDGAAYTSAMAEWRFTDHIAGYFQAKLGYGQIDERALQYLDLGGKLRYPLGRVTPYLRLGLVHQHESPGDAIDRDAVAVLSGFGDGIRHRAGGSLGVGLDIDIVEHKTGVFYAAFEAGSVGFVNPEKGPSAYVGAGLSVGLTFDIGAGKRAK